MFEKSDSRSRERALSNRTEEEEEEEEEESTSHLHLFTHKPDHLLFLMPSFTTEGTCRFISLLLFVGVFVLCFLVFVFS